MAYNKSTDDFRIQVQKEFGYDKEEKYIVDKVLSIKKRYYKLSYHGTGNKAKTEIEQVISQIVTRAKAKGKSIVIEKLNFKETKAKQTKAKTKQGGRTE